MSVTRFVVGTSRPVPDRLLTVVTTVFPLFLVLLLLCFWISCPCKILSLGTTNSKEVVWVTKGHVLFDLPPHPKINGKPIVKCRIRDFYYFNQLPQSVTYYNVLSLTDPRFQCDSKPIRT